MFVENENVPRLIVMIFISLITNSMNTQMRFRLVHFVLKKTQVSETCVACICSGVSVELGNVA